MDPTQHLLALQMLSVVGAERLLQQDLNLVDPVVVVKVI
jgi:hypothetical protein